MHNRRSIRLKGYDYSREGAYFITICTQHRRSVFGKVVQSEVELNDSGRMVVEIWNSLESRFPYIGLDAFIVMPNHIHAIIFLPNEITTNGTTTNGATTNGATTRVAPTGGDDTYNMLGNIKHPNNIIGRDDAMRTEYDDDVGATLVVAPNAVAPNAVAPNAVAPNVVAPNTVTRYTIGDVVGAFKSLTTYAYARGVKMCNWERFPGRLWQRNYYEHIIRSTESLYRIRTYIYNNPLRWWHRLQ